MFQINEGQKRFFETFGYLVIKGLFATEADEISRRFDMAIEKYSPELIDWKHRAHANDQRHFLTQFIDREEYFSALLDDERILGIYKGLLGDDFTYRGSDANLMNCSTCWHSDTYGALLKYRNVKIIFYLDQLEADSGCFRVLPGSQHFGDKFANKLQAFLKKNDSYIEDLGLQDHEVPATIVPTSPGDVVVFDFRVKHATCFANERLRRMFTICATERIHDEDIPALRGLIAAAGKAGIKSYYGDAMVRTAGPERMQHLQQCLDNQDALFSL
ncbi:MAG TPA: phytanoyl-CoA dioxygenase family protein [Pseudomonadales bacterium]|nr:phytanoyl-CoA dioxygenase family protein [Pseudomonadales bacterium]